MFFWSRVTFLQICSFIPRTVKLVQIHIYYTSLVTSEHGVTIRRNESRFISDSTSYVSSEHEVPSRRAECSFAHTLLELMKISPRRNLSTSLLIRRASRATFPDMGRLTDSLLPTTEVKITKQFCFLLIVVLLILIVVLLCCYTVLLKMLTYWICCLTKDATLLKALLY